MRARRNGLFLGASLIGFWVLVALLAPVLPVPDPSTQNLAKEFFGPEPGHPLGFGENGVDVLSHIVWATRLSMLVGLAAVLCSALIGATLGAWAGYRRGWVDAVLMRVVDMVYAFPGILLVVALAAFLGPSARNVMIALIVTSWAGYVRVARNTTLSLREREFIVAARAIGSPVSRVLVRHVLPNLLGPVLVQMTYGLGAAILTESSLSFLGLGAPAGTPSWGQMLNQGRETLTTATHLVISPGVALMTAVLGFNLFGDGLRDWIDPRLRS